MTLPTDTDNLDTQFGEHGLYEIYLEGEEATEGDGLVWKEILREGDWAYRPGGGKPVPIPLKVRAGHAVTKEEIGMADLIDAFEDGAVDHVTVPLTHDDKVHENTGFVRKLKIDGEENKKVLMAGIEFTEPDIKEKTVRGSIANTSVGIMFDYLKKDSGKRYNEALGHVALTNKPWINGMKPFGTLASENYSEDETDGLVLVRDAKLVINDELVMTDIKVSFNDSNSLKDSATNTGADSQDTNEGGSLSMAGKEEVKETTTEQAPSSDPPAPVELSEEARDEIVAKAKAELSEQYESTAKENASLRAKVHAMEVDSRITELADAGFDTESGLLKTIRKLMLADTGSEVLTLSEDDTEIKLSITGALEQVIEALPKKDGKLHLGDQASLVENHDEPAVEPEAEKPLNEKVGEWVKDLGLNEGEFALKDGDN